MSDSAAYRPADAPSLPRSWVLAGLVVLAVRLALLVFSAPGETVLEGDEPYYDELARGMIANGTYGLDGEPSVHRPPGWPAILAVIYRLMGESRRVVVMWQALFDFGTVMCTAWMAGRLFRSRAATVVGFALAVTWPPFLREALHMQTEPLFTMVVAVLLVVFFRFIERPSVWHGLAVGVATGIASLVRPTGIVILAGLGLGWLIQTRGRGLLRIPALVAMAVGLIAILAPWAVRNYRAVHSFVPIAVGSGEQFFLGSLLETGGRWNHDIWWPIRDNAIRDEEARLGRTLNAAERDNVWLERGREIWREHPGKSLAISIRRFARLVALPVLSEDRPWLRLGFLAVLFTLYFLALPTGVRGLRTGDHSLRFAGVLLVMVVLYAVVSSMVYTTSRFFEPVRTVFLVLAAGPISRRWFARLG